MKKLTFPFTEEKIRALKVGDEVLISGVVFTGRDAVHKYLHEGGKLPPGVNLRDGILYHCGPVVMKQDDGTWKATAAGPTTSIREEPYQAQIIKEFRPARRHRQGRHGRQDAGGVQGIRLRVSARGRRRGAGAGRVHQKGAQRLSDGTNSARRRRSGNLKWRIFPPSSRWTRTAIRCTRKSLRRARRNWRSGCDFNGRAGAAARPGCAAAQPYQSKI